MAKQVTESNAAAKVAAATAKLSSQKEIDADILDLAQTPSDGGILRLLMAKAVGAGVAAARREEDGWRFYPTWDKVFCPAFYKGERVRPKVHPEKGDNYGIAMDRFGDLGATAAYDVADRYRVMEFTLAIKGDSTGGYGVPKRGSFIAKVLKAHPDSAPTDTQLKAIRAKEIADAKARGTTSEFKTRAANLAKGMISLATAADIDAVLAEYPAVAAPFIAAEKAVTNFAKLCEVHFKAKAEQAKAAKAAEKAGKPAKSAKTGMTAAERNKAAAEKFAAIAAMAAKGSNGNKRQRPEKLDA